MDAQILIDGELRDASSGRTITIHNPAHPVEVVGTIPMCDGADVDLAVAAARRAQPAWTALSLDERVAMLAAAAADLAPVIPDAATLLTREMGKILAESFNDVGAAHFMLNFLPNEAQQTLAAHRMSDDFGTLAIERRPLGVVAIIVPWNWPVSLLFVRLASALAMGNTTVCLPSPYASLSVLHCVAALCGALPRGTVNSVSGWGAEVGAALTRHPGVAKISFTGGTETGRDVLRAAAEGVTRTSLELGGNDAAILLDDVRVDDALATSLVEATLTTSGQVCFAAKRILVAESIYDSVVDAFRAAVDKTVLVGDGLQDGVTMGPLVNARQLERFDRIVEASVERGAKVFEAGTLASDADPAGYFRRPLIVTGLDDESALVVEEQFGPAVPFQRFATVDEAVAKANSTDFGLGSSVWSADVERARSVARRLEAGMVFLNRHNMAAAHPRGAFGGTKRSGYGRELGRWGMESYSEVIQIVDPPAAG
jgi:aldehyde dehydrogenase